jgi:predicted dehydrogenase
VIKPIGVGFLGAGPATQAIHIPALATLGDRFHIVKVMDIDASLAHTVAKRTGATPTTSLEDVLTDTSVDVVAVTSPNAFHANQVIAACTAGKRAILCEKPLAVTAGEARRIAAASATSGTPVVVGTMHAFDPAVVAALDAWAELGEPASFVHSSIYLPRNRSFASAATFIELPPDAEGHGGNAGGRTTHEMFGDVVLRFTQFLWCGNSSPSSTTLLSASTYDRSGTS